MNPLSAGVVVVAAMAALFLFLRWVAMVEPSQG